GRAGSDPNACTLAKRFGLRADVGHEERSDQERQATAVERGIWKGRPQLNGADRECGVGKAIERGVKERAERRAAASRARELPVEGVAQRPEQEHQQGRTRLSRREERD